MLTRLRLSVVAPLSMSFTFLFCAPFLCLHTASLIPSGPDGTVAAQETREGPFLLDPALLAEYRWRNIGPDRGGRSIAVSGVVGRPQEAYFGATGGGLWKTTDGGENWIPVTDFKITSASVGAVAVSETRRRPLSIS